MQKIKHMKQDRIPKENEVFFKNGFKEGHHYQIMRRVIAVRNGWVFYSDGKNKNQACTITAFQEWLADAFEIPRQTA